MPFCIFGVRHPAGFAARDESRFGAVAGPWRAGAGAGDLAGRTDRAYRQLRFDRDPLLADTASPTVVAMPGPLNAVAVAGDGEIAAGGADGRVYFLNLSGARAGEVAAGPRPVISVAVSPDGALVAAASIGGSVGVIDR